MNEKRNTRKRKRQIVIIKTFNNIRNCFVGINSQDAAIIEMCPNQLFK